MSGAAHPFSCVAILFVATFLASCAVAKTANMCPDTPPRCLTEPVCATDPSRGCQVCRCGEPAYVPIEQKPPGQ
jgi:hypothetical protein